MKNIGDADRTARLVLGAVLGVLFFGRRFSGAAVLVLGILSVFFLGTSVMGWCPFYALLRISTRRATDAGSPTRAD